MDGMRRSLEPSAPGRGVKPSVQAARSATDAMSAAPLLWLQSTAGNRAVTGLLKVQRAPDPVVALEPTIADRITEAREQVTKGEIDAPAFEHYRTSTTGTAAAVAELLWQNELHPVDIEPAGSGIYSKSD